MSRRTKEIRIMINDIEDKDIRENAAKLNMQIAPYMRMVAQNPTIINFNYSAIERHTQQVGQIVNSVNQLIFTIEVNNEYQPKEIDAISEYLDEIWKTEKELLVTVRKQWEEAVKPNKKRRRKKQNGN